MSGKMDGQMMYRSTLVKVKRMNKMTFKTKTMVAIVERPVNWYGRLNKMAEVIPVPIVTLNHL